MSIFLYVRPPSRADPGQVALARAKEARRRYTENV